MENTNIRLFVPNSARGLDALDYSIILGSASYKAGLKIKERKFKIKMPGFSSGYYNEGIYEDFTEKGLFGSLIVRAYDYPTLGLGSFRLKAGYRPFPEIYSPRINSFAVFNSDRSSLAKIEDSKLREFLANFYEELKIYPEKNMKRTLANGHTKEHPSYKKMEEMLEDFEEFFSLPYKEYSLPGRKSA